MAKGAFSFMDIINSKTKAAVAGETTEYTEIFLNPFEVKPTESNFYSQENIEELADSILTVGQQQPTVLARIKGEYKIISGHRRNLANQMLVNRGYEEYKRVRYLYKDMTDAMLELSLIVGNAYNRELTAYEKTEQAIRLKNALIRAKNEDGLKIQGRLRDIIADILGESSTNIGRMESINNNLTDEAKEEFKKGKLSITGAYEASKLSEDEQHNIAKALQSGVDIRAKEIAEKVKELKTVVETVEEEYRTPHPESITSLCYSCKSYSTCNVKTSTCKNCDEYINKTEYEKTEEQKYNEEQEKIDKETKKKLQEKAAEERLDNKLSDDAVKIHKVKISSEFFEDVESKIKNFELRKNDRDYKVGDKLKMFEVKEGTYTGRTIEADIIYILEEFKGLKEGYCILGIESINSSRK